MKDFFYKYWWLYYILFFLLLGVLIFALLWKPNVEKYLTNINELNSQLEDCRNEKSRVDTITSVKDSRDSKVNSRINCDAVVNSGGQGVTKTQHDLGERSGMVVIHYDMATIPDEITVTYDNVVVAGSNGLVSGENSIQFKYTALPGKPTYCVVNISAPGDGTKWSYLLNCPQ